MKRLGLILLLLVVVGFLTKGVWLKKENLEQGVEDYEEGGVDEFANVKQYKIIDCPEITDLANKTLQTEINEGNKNMIDRIVGEEHMENAIVVKSQEEIPEGPYVDWLEIYCPTIRNDDAIFTQKFSIGSYGAGAAHPNHFETSKIYSIKSGKELSLSDLFKPDTDYLKIVTERARFYLNRDYGVDSQWIIDGTSSESHFSDFLVEDEGLKIGFDQYQVAPYSEGFIEILIPKAELGPNYLY